MQIFQGLNLEAITEIELSILWKERHREITEGEEDKGCAHVRVSGRAKIHLHIIGVMA